MRLKEQSPQRSRFYLRDLDNHVLVESNGDGVTVCASRDNFPPLRKSSFIRHLAAEGHIPARYEWFAEASGDKWSAVQWVVSDSPTKDLPLARRLSRRVRRNIFYGCLFALWVILVMVCGHYFRSPV